MIKMLKNKNGHINETAVWISAIIVTLIAGYLVVNKITNKDIPIEEDNNIVSYNKATSF